MPTNLFVAFGNAELALAGLRLQCGQKAKVFFAKLFGKWEKSSNFAKTIIFFARAMIYEWDDNKRASNLIKHKLDFVDVMAVFDDPDRIEKIDNRKDYGEIRIRTIGMLKEELIEPLFIQTETTK